jgi:hypothetical protein
VVIARKAAIALRKNVILLWDLYAKFFDYGVSQGHFAKNRNLAFSAFFLGNVNSQISRGHCKNGEHHQNRAPDRADPD